jgi:hypothetical protein
MADPNEIAALKASFKGALQTAVSLEALKGMVESLGPGAEPSPEDLDTLGRVSAAHAIASNALRGLVVTMLNRRGAGTV